ncbi:hypothetical protein CBR_g9056 [Chara braunii]|uniref:Reverse transcriptase domain-containing protein n=1 Tax=Chara braunii TaxID=69332 RepID=A0A388KNK0_CHABU|nr:hypothetical protein CBR_g9056 [Chara braunii]|eukprot:GBG71640.1 hypothetical protein CBR_g9056 [Chara braunii]
MDDILVFSEIHEYHVEHIEWVLHALKDAGFKVALEKSEFFLSEISFLGYIVTVDGLKPDPRKVAAVQDAPALVTLTRVRAFLGLASYYRRFIKGFAGIAKPLTNLLKKEERLIWTPECEAAFQALKEALTSAPVLARPDPTRPFTLYTDWQPQAISAVLTQHGKDGREHVIEYASKTLSQAQANYEACKGECLAVVWGIQHFRPYLYGQKFVLVTDHQPLLSLRNNTDYMGTLGRWTLTAGPYPMREFLEYLVELTDVESLPFADEDAWELHHALYKSVALGMFRFFVDHEDHATGEHFVVYYVITRPKPAEKEGTVALYPFAQLQTIDPGFLELIHLELLSIAQVIASEEEEIQPRLRTATDPLRTYNAVVIPDYIAQRAERLDDFSEERPLRPPSSYSRPAPPKAAKKTPKRKRCHPSPGAQGSRIGGGEEVIQPARAATLVKETIVPSPPIPRVPDLNLDGVGPSSTAAGGGGSRMGFPDPISGPPVLAGPLLALEKSEFFLSEISFLGYIVTVDGLKPDPRKVAAVQDAPALVTLTRVRAFLGLASYYRRFIKGFAGIAKPLTNLLKKEERLIWTPECEAAFQALKEALTSAPVLARPDPTRPFTLYTDWQPQAISAVLTQHGKDGREHVIEYASKTLSQAQANYEACKGECLAVVWGIQHFRPYLYGQKFVLVTDHQPLLSLRNNTDYMGTLGRWTLTAGPYPMREFLEYLVELTDVESLPFADEDAWELHHALYKSVALGMFRFFVDHEDHATGEHFVVYYVITRPKPAEKEGTVALYPFAQLQTIDPGFLELIHLELLSIAQVIASEEEEIQPRLRTATDPLRTYNAVVIPDYIAQRAERLDDFSEERPLRPPSSYSRPAPPKAAKKTPKRKRCHPSPGAQGSRIGGGEEVIQPARAATLVKETIVPSPPIPRVPDLNLDGVGPSSTAAGGGGSRMGFPDPISGPPVLAGPLRSHQPPRGAPVVDLSSSSEPDGPSDRGGLHGGARHH